MKWSWWLLLLVLAIGCSRDDKPDDDDDTNNNPGGTPGTPAPPTSGPGTTSSDPTVPRTATPPFGVTWQVAVTENLSQARLDAIYASFVAANNSLWNISEGQVRCAKIVITDNVAPGVSAQQFMFGGGAINASLYDIIIWPASTWDVQASGAVSDQQGRNGRLMIIPENVSTFVLLHECGHLLFHLTWTPGQLLVDEYRDGVQDTACVMESENTPTRWCSDANHTNQMSQPHACWNQILKDYPNFSYSGADSASGLPAVPEVTYNDAP
ncbi:MAG: hypothetical protein ACYTGN_13765 [Planctomycetota bacterium]|jgi:hypothetical protein